MKVAIYGLTCQNSALDYIVELLDELHKENAEIYFEKDFYKLCIENQTPEGMALFAGKYEWDNQVFFPFYFSPASVQFAKTLISSYSGAPCEQPKKEFMKLLVGRPFDFDLLE